MAAFSANGATNTSTGTSLTVPFTTVSANDFLRVSLVIQVAESGALAGLTNNSSFTVYHDEYINIGGSQYHWILAWKRAAGSESGSVTFSWTTSSGFNEGKMARFTGVSTADNPPFQFAAGSQTSTATHTAPSIDSTYSNSLWLYDGAEDNYGSWTTVSGFTEHWDGGASTFGTLQSKALSASGATGTADSTSTAGGGQAASLLLFDTSPTGGGPLIAPRALHQFRLRR